MSDEIEGHAVLLVESCGDAARSARAVDDATAIAAAKNGRVVRAGPGEIACVFDHPGDALAAAMTIAERRTVQPGSMRVSLDHGDVRESPGGASGAPIEGAARLLRLAELHEILATRAFYEHLTLGDRSLLIPCGTRAASAGDTPDQLYSFLPPHEARTHDERSEPIESEAPRVALACPLTGAALTVDEAEIVIGRSRRCALVVPQGFVSREHATVLVESGRAYLRDHSSTGTWLCTPGRSRLVLRGEQAPLAGRGVFFLGADPDASAHAPCIEFRVEPREAPREVTLERPALEPRVEPHSRGPRVTQTAARFA